MSMNFKYATDRTNIFVLSYVYDCVYWYAYEALGKWFVENLGKIFHVNFLGYAHWFMPIRISQMKDHSISGDQARYATSIVSKYLDTVTFKTSAKFFNTTFPSDIIFTKSDVSTSDKQVEKFSGEFNINYRAFIVLFIYLLS